MTRTAFHHLNLYPELHEIISNFEVFRDEALFSRPSMNSIDDSRVKPGIWSVLPLLPEEEDKNVVPENICHSNRLLAPRSTAILSAISGLRAYAFSALAPGGHIAPHKHTNPYVTAMLCLINGGNSYIMVGGERRNFHDREVIVFDYTMEHEVFNHGIYDRIVLLMLFDNRM